VPVWHDKTKSLVAEGKLVVIGVAQEQHADRCRLFLQWQRIGWPVMHDPVNSVGIDKVPVAIAIDENGIVRDAAPQPDAIESAFVNKSFKGEAESLGSDAYHAPDPRVTRRRAGEAKIAEVYCDHGQALVLAGAPAQVVEAIETYEKAVAENKKLAEAHFGLGVAYRMRCDGPGRQPGDFQAAVSAWESALRLAPNNYICRRRIQQYGPRLDKPYPFYDWVATARSEIESRGETPVPLVAEPIGAELADKDAGGAVQGRPPKGDRQGKIDRDDAPLILLEPTVVHSTQRSKTEPVEVHLSFRPDPDRDGHWNNEAEPLRVWLAKVKGAKVSPRFLEAAAFPGAVSDETRTLSFAVTPGKKAKRTLTVKGYALYNICQGAGGKCLYRRQDFRVKIKR
jgi:hypothetical protein